MHSKQNILLVFCLSVLAAAIVSPFAATAQIKYDTLKAVKIRGKHKPVSTDTRLNDFSTGQKIQTIDSITLQQYNLQNMATLLSQQMPVFVKSYSFNGLATLHFRGASAAQSQVLWNGIPIQNASLGVADISTLPVLFMSKVNIVYGGSGALFGSGNIGGALLLENDKPVFDTTTRHFSISGGAGSFGQYSGGIKGSISGKRWYLSANTFIQRARNNYTYINAANSEQRMQNARLQSNAAMLQAAYKLNAKNTLGLSVWHQQYDRQIPPALFEAYSVKHQQDGSLRLVTDWKREQERNTFYAKASLIKDVINYSDTAVQVATNNSVYQYYHEVGWKQRTGTYGQLLIFAPVQISWIPTTDTQQQNRIALVSAYTLQLLDNRINITAQVRAERINTTNIFLPGGGVSLRITDWFQLRANVQRTYRMPTLNELYYFPGGNPRLKPEQGWNMDAGYTVKAHTGSFNFYHDVSAFNRRIHDWIQWLGGAVWTPHNIALVHSRGIETDNKITFKTGNWQFHAAVSTAYILATTAESYLLNDGSTGKQIPYTPRYNGRLNIGLAYREFHLNYNHTYTGYRFITTDESAYLEPYQTGNIQAMYSTRLYTHGLQLSAQINNVWNEKYAVAGFRPMPRANCLLGVKVEL